MSSLPWEGGGRKEFTPMWQMGQMFPPAALPAPAYGTSVPAAIPCVGRVQDPTHRLSADANPYVPQAKPAAHRTGVIRPARAPRQPQAARIEPPRRVTVPKPPPAVDAESVLALRIHLELGGHMDPAGLLQELLPERPGKCDQEALDEALATLLHYLCRLGWRDCVAYLIGPTLRVPVNATIGDWKVTPLHMAARNGRTATVKHLLEAGADIRALDDQGLTPLQAGEKGAETARLLVQILEPPAASRHRQ
eukprot:TRINITY_DN3280_c0_g1_i1.p1 TRINITY_DN3280_c0_g1~~TRINITY_DN3280_c0_g1_i1.p1  ORF type:complete len:250 (+),score=1.03 TRINITY_DN3280_c0_g1_i1:431-1180(+)